jgi:hypothetical protein
MTVYAVMGRTDGVVAAHLNVTGEEWKRYEPARATTRQSTAGLPKSNSSPSNEPAPAAAARRRFSCPNRRDAVFRQTPRPQYLNQR